MALVAAGLGCAKESPAIAPRPAAPPESGVERLAEEVTPLPGELEDEMFRRIARKEAIDLKVVYQALVGSQTTLRAYAARYLGSHGDDSSVPHLVDALRDQSQHDGADYPDAGMATTRYWANASLVKLTRQDFGFAWNDPIDQRDRAIRRWHAWYRETHRAR